MGAAIQPMIGMLNRMLATMDTTARASACTACSRTNGSSLYGSMNRATSATMAIG